MTSEQWSQTGQRLVNHFRELKAKASTVCRVTIRDGMKLGNGLAKAITVRLGRAMWSSWHKGKDNRVTSTFGGIQSLNVGAILLPNRLRYRDVIL